MGASVQPQGPGDRISRNIAAMRAQGANEKDIEAYLTQVEGLKPEGSGGITARGLGRSFTQGATFNFGDELGLTDRSAEKAFQQAHPVADFFAKLGGGLLAPAAAVVAAPAAAMTLPGAIALGGITSALAGAGEGTDAASRAKGAVTSGLLGAGMGATGYGVGKVVGGIANTVADRMNPERAVARAAQSVLTPATVARMKTVDALAPGGTSVASATFPADATNATSRFLSMVRGIGANPNAARAAEGQLMGQKAAIKAGTDAVGANMDALAAKEVSVTPSLRNALIRTKSVLGGKAPPVPSKEVADINPLGIEKSTPFEFDPGRKTLSVEELRDALTRIRYAVRQAEKRGTEANGATLYELKAARSALTKEVYDAVPDYAELDAQYATLKNEQRQVDKLTKTVRLSRQNYAGNEAFKATAGSLGGSLPRGSHSVIMSALDKILTNKAGAADAVARYVTRPGGPEMVDQLLSLVPKGSTLTPRLRAAGTAALTPALQSLLFPQP